MTETTCPYCGVGCGIDAAAGPGRALSVKGLANHPANFGRLCSKGTAVGETVGSDGRLLHPEIGGRRLSWNEAFAHVGERLSRIIREHGPDAVGFYVSGQLLTEDYYAANKLMKGFIGSGNIDTNSRLCMASAVAAHKQAFGADLVPGCYEDLDLAELVVFSGHNAAWTHPVLFRRMEAARGRGQKHVVIDPRRTDTAEGADLHLAIAPQTDVRLWNGLLADLVRRRAVDEAYVAAHVCGFDAVKAALAREDQSPSAVAADCGVPLERLLAFFKLFAASPKTVSLFSMGANQSAQGVAKGLAILNAHLATGRIGKPGASPFSITGQPNAMGGRESGGMATTLAAHMDFDAEEVGRVGRFWGAPRIAARPGLKAVDLFEAVDAGEVKAVWIMATNPAVSMPDAERVRRALAKCPLVVISDCIAHTDTAAFAHVKLPALAWGEKDGTVTNSERRISRQRAVLPAPGEALPDWRIVAGVADAMGFGDAFSWQGPAQVFREYVRLTAYENGGSRTLDLGPLVAITPTGYDALRPVQWPIRADGSGTARLFTDGVFATPDGRARMISVAPKAPATATDGAFPLSLNTGRIRDHWHTLTRTGLAPGLFGHVPEPYLEIHPDDAAAAGVREGVLTRIETARGVAVAIARVSDRQRPGSVFLPMHWTDAFAPRGRANALVAPNIDPVSGQPEFKHTPARVRPYRETWRGFFLGRGGIAPPPRSELIWRRIPQSGCQLVEFAGRGDEAEREALRRHLLKGVAGDAVVFADPGTGARREAYVKNGRLEHLLFLGPASSRLPPRGWLASLFGEARLNAEQRAALLHGIPPGGVPASGPQVCACLLVSEKSIAAAVLAGACDPDAVGAATGAGTNCGSCRPEIARLIAAAKPAGAGTDRHAA